MQDAHREMTRNFWRNGCFLLALILLNAGCIVSISTKYELITNPQDIPGLVGTYYIADGDEVKEIKIKRIERGKYDLGGAYLTTSRLRDNYFLAQIYSMEEQDYTTYLLSVGGGFIQYLGFEEDDNSNRFDEIIASIKTEKKGLDAYRPGFAEGQLNRFKKAIRDNFSLIDKREIYLGTRDYAEEELEKERTEKEVAEAFSFIEANISKNYFTIAKEANSDTLYKWNYKVSMKRDQTHLTLSYEIIRNKFKYPVKRFEPTEPFITTTTIRFSDLAPNLVRSQDGYVKLSTRDSTKSIRRTKLGNTSAIFIKAKPDMDHRVAKAFENLIRLSGGRDSKY